MKCTPNLGPDRWRLPVNAGIHRKRGFPGGCTWQYCRRRRSWSLYGGTSEDSTFPLPRPSGRERRSRPPCWTGWRDTVSAGEGKVKGALFHSDQGWQYQRKEFGDILKGYGRIQTMSRKGNCHDNSVMENFFGGSRPRCSTDRKTDTGTTAALRRQSWSTSTGTTQVGWKSTSIGNRLRRLFPIPVLFDNISLLGSSFGVQNISTNHSPGKIRKEDGFSVLEKYRKIYFFSSLSLADFSFSLFPFVASIMASVRRAHEYLRAQRTMTIGKPGRTNSFLFRFTNQFFHQS